MDSDTVNVSGMSLKRYSLSASLRLLVLVCFLPAVFVTVFLGYSNYVLQRDRTYEETLRVARRLSADVDREIAGVITGLRVLATSQFLLTDDLAAFHQLARETLRHQVVFNFLVRDPQGRQRLNTQIPFGQALPKIAMRQDMARVFETGEPVLGDIFVGAIAREPLVPIGVPVYRNKKVVYSLNVGLYPERIESILSSHELPEGWIATVLDGSGTIVARSHEMKRFVGTRATEPVLDRLLQAREGTLETQTKEGIPVILSFTHSANSNWAIAVGAPKAVLDAELVRLGMWAAGATLVAFLLVLWLVSRIAQRVTASIRGLNDAAIALSQGQTVKLPSIQLTEAEAVGEAIVRASHLMERTHHQAHHDALTGLCNRVLLHELLERQLAASRRSQTSCAVLAIDLDGFKDVNDQYGHAAGDKVLKLAADRIMSSIRASDVAARLGGDEFCVLQPDIDLANATNTAERLVAALAQPYPGIAATLSASVGIGIFPQSGDTEESLLRGADQALYRAKNTGKNKAVLAD